MSSLSVNLFIRHYYEADGIMVGTGDPDEFVASLKDHGFYIHGLTHEDSHRLETQWIEGGFEVIIMGDADG